MAEAIAARASNLIITESGNPRQSPLAELADAMAWSGATGEQIAELGPALERAKTLAGERGAVVVTGSLYLVGKAMKLLGVPAGEEE
jgi:folylpolyglutamate synthase/dihydropteroate synthase